MTPIDRAAELRRDAEHQRAARANPRSLVLPVWRSKSFIPNGEARDELSVGHAGALLASGTVVWLGRLGERDCFAVELDAGLDDPLVLPELRGRGEFHELRLVGSLLEPADAGLLAYARGILYWHKHHRFCPSCGGPTVPKQAGHVRACSGCQKKHFPRVEPAIMLLVVDGDRCLLARQPGWPKGMYSALAGFVETGESLEDAARREAFEEVGLELTELRYVQSQPWPFPASLMLGFMAHAKPGEIRLDKEELEEARWVSRDEVRRADGFFIPPPFSLAHQLIMRFVGAP
ncbi:MAG: NAD(+) diphosphatase [Myxococcales bacterium]|nr:NAD(+) diphosphatase [Myxococcales bacterium]